MLNNKRMAKYIMLGILLLILFCIGGYVISTAKDKKKSKEELQEYKTISKELKEETDKLKSSLVGTLQIKKTLKTANIEVTAEDMIKQYQKIVDECTTIKNKIKDKEIFITNYKHNSNYEHCKDYFKLCNNYINAVEEVGNYFKKMYNKEINDPAVTGFNMDLNTTELTTYKSNLDIKNELIQKLKE